jgi:glycosyltransferase involved in cell wall biosynthesis
LSNKFSIVSSLYNSENYIENYFKTIFSQKLLPEEVIIIDDTNNPKNLEKIIEKKKIFFRFNNIILIKNNFNYGPAISLNKGLAISKNKLIFRIDIDDIWYENHTLEMLKLYENNPNYLIYANSIKKRSFLTDIKCDDYFINENHLVHSSWLINMNVCKNFRYHMLKPSIGLEDYFTLLYYSKNYKIFYTFKKTVDYLNFQNSHGKVSRKHKNYLKIRNKISRIFLYNNLKNKNFFQKIYFVIFNFGLVKFLFFLINFF